jgi:outer membrane protein OmpA-like peptidoglycan-associated protein
MKMLTYLAAGACIAMAAGNVLAHTSDDHAESAGGYIGANGQVLKTGLDNCLHSGTFSSDAPINACEGIEDEDAKATADAGGADTAGATETAEVPKAIAKIDTGELSELALFDTGSDALNTDGESAMESLFAQVAEYKGITGITVVGHADSRGEDDFNMDLSERRAQAVADVLATRYPDARIEVIGKGETEPKASNDTAEGRQINRRVEVEVIATRMTFE